MYRTVEQLDTVISTLGSTASSLCEVLRMPESSVQGHEVLGLKLAAGDGGIRPGVLLIGGTHARELMNPDLLVELAVDLVSSHRSGTDIVLGNRTWAAATVRTILDTVDLYLLPCINPDGRRYVMTVDDMWRKNRRDNPASSCDSATCR